MLDVRPVLARIAQYAPDRIPADRDGTVDAWNEHFSEYPHLTLEETLAAVTTFFKQTQIRPGVILPSDISGIAREIHQDAAMRRPSRTEHDGSNYGRIEHVTDEISIEVDARTNRETGEETVRYRFCWDGPVHQPFVGAWYDTKQQAIRDGIDWCEHSAVRTGDDVTAKRLTGVEHSPGAPCVVPECPKPSTFDEFCARHYCLSKGRSLGLAW